MVPHCNPRTYDAAAANVTAKIFSLEAPRTDGDPDAQLGNLEFRLFDQESQDPLLERIGLDPTPDQDGCKNKNIR